jgi:hypothetical protein
MAIIKSGATTDELTVDPTSKAARVTIYRSDGTEIVDHVPTAIAVGDVTAINNDLIASFDASQFSYVSFQLKGTWVGAVKFQASNDNGTFKDVVVQNVGDIVEPYRIESNGNSMIKIPVLAKYLRVRVTSYTSGTVEGSAFGYEEDVHTGQISSTGEVTIAASQTVDNLNKLAGNAISMGAGVADAGTQRVVLPTGNVSVVIKPGADLLTAFILGTTGTNQANVVSAPCILRSIVFTNYAATPRHLKLYNTAGTPTAGSAGVVIQCSMAAAGTLVYPLPVEGFTFTNGIGRTMVLGADEASTSPATTAPDFSVSLIYQLI